MVSSVHRVLILVICVGFLAVEQNIKVHGLTSTELAIRRSKITPGTVPSSTQRILSTDSNQNKAFDPYRSSKRRVRKGSNPIHNRS
ncbi:hypothetical protein JCGZ_15606 [Jatropha curcas]|uniref:Uncharacterized protein n=1 Tax=Jatropha curcas TaxID=180498 RepID=A0A067LAU7_JATCU|nr:hypothetical protein JCGZ_15606 [Jatropha curcas]